MMPGSEDPAYTSASASGVGLQRQPPAPVSGASLQPPVFVGRIFRPGVTLDGINLLLYSY